MDTTEISAMCALTREPICSRMPAAERAKIVRSIVNGRPDDGARLAVIKILASSSLPGDIVEVVRLIIAHPDIFSIAEPGAARVPITSNIAEEGQCAVCYDREGEPMPCCNGLVCTVCRAQIEEYSPTCPYCRAQLVHPRSLQHVTVDDIVAYSSTDDNDSAPAVATTRNMYNLRSRERRAPRARSSSRMQMSDQTWKYMYTASDAGVYTMWVKRCGGRTTYAFVYRDESEGIVASRVSDIYVHPNVYTEGDIISRAARRDNAVCEYMMRKIRAGEIVTSTSSTTTRNVSLNWLRTGVCRAIRRPGVTMRYVTSYDNLRNRR